MKVPYLGDTTPYSIATVLASYTLGVPMGWPYVSGDHMSGSSKLSFCSLGLDKVLITIKHCLELREHHVAAVEVIIYDLLLALVIGPPLTGGLQVSVRIQIYCLSGFSNSGWTVIDDDGRGLVLS